MLGMSRKYSEPMITIPIEDFKALVSYSKLCQMLLENGVENWEGYDSVFKEYTEYCNSVDETHFDI